MTEKYFLVGWTGEWMEELGFMVSQLPNKFKFKLKLKLSLVKTYRVSKKVVFVL